MKIAKSLILFSLAFILTSCNYPIVLHVDCEDIKALIEAIDLANSTPTTEDTIELAKGCVYSLDQVHNNINGSNGLPSITSPIRINGYGATIMRNEKATEKFRLFHVSAAGTLNVDELTLEGGFAFDPNNPTILGNNTGGAVLNLGELNIHHTKVVGNNAYGEGGGIANIGTLIVKASTISNNECYVDAGWSMGGGAGIYNLEKATITLSNISENGTSMFWDGIFNGKDGFMQVKNTTISGNGTTGIDNEGTLILDYVTFANQPIGLIAYSGNVTVRNTLFGPPAAGAGFISCKGPSIHLYGANIDTDGSCGASMTVPPEALFLGPLGDHGGPTLTHALLPNSPAIDAATENPGTTSATNVCPPTDQRGEPRPVGTGCDIGAYEYQKAVSAAKVVVGTPTPTATSTATPTPTYTPVPQSQACTVTALVNLFCRPAPGYDAVDSFVPGQSALVVAQSQFLWQVNGPNFGDLCTVPKDDAFVKIEGDCDNIPYFTPLLAPTPIDTPTSKPVQGCTVRQAGGAIICVYPCPDRALPGDACTPYVR